MPRMGGEPGHSTTPETTGITLHRASEYDLFTSLFGLGSNGRNSKMVIELAGIKPGDRVLDVGCGTGSLTLTAQTAAGPSGQVYGIDASPEMIEVARQKATRTGLPVHFELGLIEQLDLPDAAFDVVITRLAMHHLPDDLKRRGLAEILRVLKPGGRLLIADFVPPTNPLLGHLMAAAAGHRMMQSNVWALPPMLTNAGFVEVNAGRTRSAFLAFVEGKKPGN